MNAIVRKNWNLNGNDNIDDTENFIGTTDLVDFPIRTNNIERAKFLSTGNFNILVHTGINTDAMEKHTLAIGDPGSFESGSSYIDVFSTTAKIQSRVPDDNGLVGCLLDITTKDEVIDVTSPVFSLAKLRLTNEQDVDSGVGSIPIQGLDCILTNNGNIQTQPSGSGWLDTVCNFKLVQNGIDQEMANFSFHSGRGINGEAINNYEVVSGTPIIVQLGADLLADMTNYAESGSGAAIVLSQVGVQGRCFGTTVGVGSTSTGGFFSASGGSKNIGIRVIGDYSQFAGLLGIGIVPTVQLHVDTNKANTTAIMRLENTAGNIDIFRSDADPEGAIIASIGDLNIDSTNGLLYIKQTGTATNTGWIRIPSVVLKSFTFHSRDAAFGTNYEAGFYFAPITDSNLTQASTTQTLGTANSAYGAHAFIVAAAAGVTDGSDLILTVTGTSIDDSGNRTAADSEVVVANATGASVDDYFETTKKWIGQVTYTLSSTGGTAFNFDFNYGLAKYDDLSNRDFILTGFEITGLANKTDAGFNVEILHHKTTGWTYSAGAFMPGSAAFADQNADYVTETSLVNGENFAYKRTDLSELVNGKGDEGIIIRVTTTVNNSISYMQGHIDGILK